MGKQQPALLGGLFIGVLSSLPYVQWGNLCCCLWVVVGGLLVVYLQQQAKPTPVETGEAIVGGLIAGLLGGALASVVFVLSQGIDLVAMQEGMRRAFEQQSQRGQEVPPEIRAMLLNHTRAIAGIFVGGRIPIYAVFAMLGSLLGLAFFKKKTPPAPPVQG